MKKTKDLLLYKLLLAPALIVLLSFGTEMIVPSDVASAGDKKHKKSFVIEGVVSTGANIFLGEPFWDFGSPWGILTFSSVGGHNTQGERPLALTPDTPRDMILASRVDDKLAGLATGIPQNTPLRKNSTMINGAGERGSLPSVTSVKGSEQSKSLPNDSITLEAWMKASGRAKFVCKKDGTAIVKMSFKGLIENGVYSVWATYGNPDTEGFAPVPLGGTPNIIVPGSKGEAIFKRVLSDCPLTPVPGERPLLLIEVAYHSDGMVYGGVADLPDAGFPFGLTTHTQISFPVIVETIF